MYNTFSKKPKFKWRDESKLRAEVGPGKYTDSSFIGEGPKTKIVKQTPKSDLISKNPGPGA